MKNTAHFNARIPRDLMACLQAISDQERRSLTFIARTALAQWLAAPAAVPPSNPAELKVCGAEAIALMLRIPEGLRDSLKTEASELGISMNSAIVLALELWADKRASNSSSLGDGALEAPVSSLVAIHVSRALADRICEIHPEEGLSEVVESVLEEQFPGRDSNLERQITLLRDAAGLLRCLLDLEDVSGLDQRVARLKGRHGPRRAAAVKMLAEWMVAQMKIYGLPVARPEDPAALREQCLQAVSEKMRVS